MLPDKKVVNKNGIAFVSGQVATTSDAISPLKSALGDMQPRAITCFLNTLEEAGNVRGQVVGAYPAAVVNVVQVRRDTTGGFRRVRGGCRARGSAPVCRFP